ncbi:MAG: type I 3-dehydroquinate dehydratase, partial [Planctomycetes bacterium]|nr:type I 3-dehydroquinate dehydratase [Planctomycetota bacterium]
MICVTLARPRHGMMIPEHRALAERGAELVELRLDALIRKVDLRRLLRERPCPVMITCRRPEDGGQFRRGENERRLLLRAAIAGGADYPSADYVDLELDVAGEIPRFGKTKRIVSYHNFQETPENLDEIHAQLAARDPDIVKLVTLANRPSDNVRMLKLVLARNAARVKTVGFCMGEIGLPSRILTGKYGAPFTYASSQKGLAVAPGQISFDELRGLYRYDAIGPETEVYGVIGDPIAHSLSPLIHNTAFREMGLNKVYLPLRVASADLAAFLEDARWLQLKGLSVTLPHKEAVRAFLAEADETVQATGAANTVIDRVVRWVGYNTDGPAA